MTRNDSKTHVSALDCLLLTRYVSGHDREQVRSPFACTGSYHPKHHRRLAHSTLPERGARGSDFCVGNSRSNKIRTPDNFRLRVISLTCPVDVGLSHLRFSLFSFVFLFSYFASPRPSLCPSVPFRFFPWPHLHGFQLH